MDTPKLFSSGSFAKLARTTRNTLHLYDSMGLLSPSTRGDNNYRYYAATQLAAVNFIRILQELGMTLDEIKYLTGKRTPESVDRLFLDQIEKIDQKIDRWVGARKLVMTLQKTIHSALEIDESAITIQFLPAEAIVLGDLNDFSAGRNDYNALLGFYQSIHSKYPQLDLNYPVWSKYSEDRVRQGDWDVPDRYYFYNPEGYDKRPAALYAIGYARGGYGDDNELYRRLIAYIDENGFEICGDAYEEYPLNEICIADDNNYLLRLMITVREKSQSEKQ